MQQYAALVGDVIASRQTGDRERLQGALVTALETVNEKVPANQRLQMTIGDEFQGLFIEMGEAIRASLWIRLALSSSVDVRMGLGWGALEMRSENPPLGQDGPCWWRAREAIEQVERSERSSGVPRSTRTRARTGDIAEGLLNAYLATRDHIMSGWDEVDFELARIVASGGTQAEAARRVGLGQSSVSRRLHGHGILAVLADDARGTPWPTS